eukprot:6926411-Lingulodinium_polyedra.AAC.1
MGAVAGIEAEASTHAWTVSTLVLLWLLGAWATGSSSTMKSSAKVLLRAIIQRGVVQPSVVLVAATPGAEEAPASCWPPQVGEDSVGA